MLKKLTPVAGTLSLLLLGACGSSSNNGMVQPPVDGDMSPAVPTLSELYSSQPNNSYTPFGAAIERDFSSGTTAVTDAIRVSSIQRTAVGGYLIEYDDGQETLSVEFRPEHCDTSDWQYCDFDSDGRYFGFWSNTSPDALGGPGEFSYMDALHLSGTTSTGSAGHVFFVFGVTTPAVAMPDTGEARYFGRFRADAYRAGDTSRDYRQRYSGDMRLVANFDLSQINGAIDAVRGSQPGSSNRQPLPTSSFTISDGRIENGQFTATLTGMDSDPTVAFTNSVRGFMGSIRGEFYGPNARELGGAVTASRDVEGDDDDLNLHGYVLAEAEREIALDGSAQISTLVDRDFGIGATSLSGTSTATVEATSDGYRVSFTIDGTPVTVDVSEADLGGLGTGGSTFAKSVSTATESKGGYLWREWGSFPGRPEFDHMDVNAVLLVRYTPGEQQSVGSLIDVTDGYVVRGTRTAADDMPSGSARYGGRLEAKEWATTTPGSSRTAPEYRGDFSLTADFGAATVMGAVSNVGRRVGSSGSYDYSGNAATGLTFEGRVSGNAIAASALNGTGAFTGYSGTAEGAFYGPQAAEVGGVFGAENTAENKILHGWFAGRKQ